MTRVANDSVTVRIPGTTANMGPGFDAFGLAFELYNEVVVSVGQPASPFSPMFVTTGERFFRGSGLESFPFRCLVRGKVPQARGLGSSVTVRLGILLGLNEIAGRPLSKEGLFRLCADLEGHPDNAAPALLGGFTIARTLQEPVRFQVSENLRFVLLIPDFEVSTPEARKVMPRTIGVTESAANAADAAVIAAAFASKRYGLLKGAFGDRLHQPHRCKLVPFLDSVLSSAEKAGALGGWLSGSGSTICALASDEKSASAVRAAMRRIAPPAAKFLIVKADNRGARVLKAGSRD